MGIGRYGALAALVLAGAAAVAAVAALSGAQAGYYKCHPHAKHCKDHLILDYYPVHKKDKYHYRHKDGRGHHHHPHKHKPNRSDVYNEITVDGIGKKKAHTKTIAGALRLVKSNGTIHIKPKSPKKDDGAYRESLEIHKPVTIIGDVDDSRKLSPRVVVKPHDNQPCAVINTHGTVAIKNIDWVIDADDFPGNTACISALKGAVTIDDSFISGRSHGAALYVTSEHAIIRGNEIGYAGVGVLIEGLSHGGRGRLSSGPDYLVTKNTIYKTRTGIEVKGGGLINSHLVDSSIVISHNNVALTSYAGLRAEGIQNLTVEGNTISESAGSGLILSKAGGSYKANTIKDNAKDGILLISTSGPQFSNNFIVSNGQFGIQCRGKPRASFRDDRVTKNHHCICRRHQRKNIHINIHRTCYDNH